MDSRVLVVGAIIFCAGLLGGAAAYLADPDNWGAESPNEPRQALWRHLLLGWIAAASVPLFLSLVQSSVVGEMFSPDRDLSGQPIPPKYEAYLIFIGLALIAAFSSRRFIDSVSRQILQRVDALDEKTNQVAEQAEDAERAAQQAVEAIDEQNVLPLPDVEMTGDRDSEPSPAASVSALERRMLSAMTKRVYRTVTGIAEDSGLSKKEVAKLLDDLQVKGLVMLTTSPATGSPRWRITGTGIAALGAA